ncbi:hypothetical protein S83_005690 [Arachis hypogaea]
MEEKRIDFAQECKQKVKGILKLIWILEGSPEPPFNSEEYMMLYTCIIVAMLALRAIRNKHDEYMLKELAQR